MSSANFNFADVLDAARAQFHDDPQRRITDTDLITITVPRALQQLRADRPDLFFGLYGTENFKPSITDPIPFDDAGYTALVEAVIAIVNEGEDESIGDGTASFADQRSERARRS